MRNTENVYVFYYSTCQNPYHEIVFHKRATKRPSQCGVFKVLKSMQSTGEVCTIGYRTQYENEIDTH